MKAVMRSSSRSLTTSVVFWFSHNRAKASRRIYNITLYKSSDRKILMKAVMRSSSRSLTPISNESFNEVKLKVTDHFCSFLHKGAPKIHTHSALNVFKS